MNADFIPYSWPWPRFVFGDAMEIFADFGARAAVFDIEFLGGSAAGVNVNKIEEVKSTFADKFQEIFEEYDATTNIIAKNPSFQKDLKPLLNSFNENLTKHYINLEKEFESAVLDNDAYFGKRLHYFGRGFGTVNLLTSHSNEESFVKEEAKKLSEENIKHFGIKSELILKNKKKHKSVVKQNLAEFPTQKILDNFYKIGFTRVETDLDAGIRSVNIFMEKDGYIFPQLAIRPFLSVYNITEDQIDLSNNNYVIFRNVKLNDKTLDIKIPVYNKGKMLINWPKGKYEDIFINKEDKSHFSFSYLSYYKYVVLKEFEKKLNTLLEFQEKEALTLVEEYRSFLGEKENLVENTTLTEDMRVEVENYFNDLIEKIIVFSNEESILKREKEIDNAIALANSNLKMELSNVKDEMKGVLKILINLQ